MDQKNEKLGSEKYQRLNFVVNMIEVDKFESLWFKTINFYSFGIENRKIGPVMSLMSACRG